MVARSDVISHTCPPSTRSSRSVHGPTAGAADVWSVASSTGTRHWERHRRATTCPPSPPLWYHSQLQTSLTASINISSIDVRCSQIVQTVHARCLSECIIETETAGCYKSSKAVASIQTPSGFESTRICQFEYVMLIVLFMKCQILFLVFVKPGISNLNICRPTYWAKPKF